MATDNRGNSRGNRRRGRNNNPEGRNQYSSSPLTAAVTVGGAVAAGLFLWTRRNQISDQIATLGGQIGDWRDARRGDRDKGTDSQAERSERTQAEIAEEALTLKETGQPV